MRFIAFIITLLFFSNVHAKIIEHSFDIDYKTVNITGTPVQAMAINNTVPGPTIKATIGDILRITFHNKMDVETSIHWHGVLLPNSQDGVPYLTTPPIKPGKHFTYEYKVKQTGTYWYHSHTGFQEQRGLHGALVFYPQINHKKYDREYVLAFSDWIDELPSKVIANLKRDGDYYAAKKDSVQSWDKILMHGWPAVKHRLMGAWTRMGSMDFSDVGYDAFLVNGKKQERLPAKAHEQVRLRLINSASSSYFNVEFAGGDMLVIAADGIEVQPYHTKKLYFSIAETYDVVVTIPKDKAYELRATSIDGTGYSSTIIGEGQLVSAPDMPKPSPFMMMDNKMGHHTSMMDIHQGKYSKLKATHVTTLPKRNPTRKVLLNLTGDMDRYVWSFNNQTLSEAEKILIKKGENVQFILKNNTMMPHPIHLHGHFFRVLNGQGEYSPMKHSVNVPARDTVIIEFEANEEKDWFFHCHNLYHMKAGMERIVSYGTERFPSKEVVYNLAKDWEWYFSGNAGFLSNMTLGNLSASNTRNELAVEADYDYKKEYDIEVTYLRNLNRFLNIYAGGEFERGDEDKKVETTAIFGIKYMLPLLIDSDVRINSKGRVRLELGSDLQLTKRMNFEWQWNTDKEYRLSLNYAVNKTVLLTLLHDSDFKFGGGVIVNF